MNAESVGWILGAGFATSIGGLGLLLVRRSSERALDALLGFTAGIMLAATMFSLLVPSLDLGTLWEVVLGFLLGCAAIAAADRLVPHLHLRFVERGGAEPGLPRTDARRGVLLLTALTIHNVPEGMAVGVAFAAGGPELGVPIALAIGIQNIPEGFAAAAPLVTAGVGRRRAALVAAATGLVEPPAALAALAAFGVSEVALPGALAFAAGAMLYVIVDELIPESHARGNERLATLALIGGFVVMLSLDNAFG